MQRQNQLLAGVRNHLVKELLLVAVALRSVVPVAVRMVTCQQPVLMTTGWHVKAAHCGFMKAVQKKMDWLT